MIIGEIEIPEENQEKIGGKVSENSENMRVEFQSATVNFTDKIERYKNKVKMREAQDDEIETFEECVNVLVKWQVTDDTNNRTEQKRNRPKQ